MKKEVDCMDFCLNCGSILTQKKPSKKQAMLMLACSKCGYKKEETNAPFRLNSKIINHSPKQFVSIINKENQLSILPSIPMACPRCGNNNAYAWQVQTRGTDESSTQFLRCTSCGYTYRENS